MVAKTFMSLERLKNYRAYLVGEAVKITREQNLPNVSLHKYQKLETQLDWYEDEIDSVDEWITTRLQEQLRGEQDKAAREWLFPKRRSWWKRLFDKRAPYLGDDK